MAGLVATGLEAEAARDFGVARAAGRVVCGAPRRARLADRQFGAVAAHRARSPPSATAAAVVFLLLAFSVAYCSHRPRAPAQPPRREHGRTDGLGNRRKLFADMETGFGSLDRREPLAVGMFDLDGFKHYNDTFGHPAGDALLARLGGRLAAVVGCRTAAPTGSAATSS